MDEDFQRFLAGIETTRQEVNLGLHVALRARNRTELDRVVTTLTARLRDQLELTEGFKDTMNRRELLRGIGVIGVPALVPSAVVKDALTAPIVDGRTMSLSAVKRAVQDLWALRQGSHYEQLAGQVPNVLGAVQRFAHDHDGAGHEYLSLVYQVIAGAMTELQSLDVAWVAAERAIVSARASGNQAIQASAQRRYAQTLSNMDRNANAEQVALNAAQALELNDGVTLSMYGALMLSAGIAAVRQDKASTAYDYINEAQQAAKHVGEGHNHLFTAFGPTNVALHRFSIAVELGDGGSAIEQASGIDVTTLPTERQAHFRVDLAHAHVQADDNDQALTVLLEAEAIAPEEIRYHPTARTLIASMARGRPDEQVQALAQRIGLTA